MQQPQCFGYLPDGRAIYRYRLSNKRGMTVDVLTLGAIIQSWSITGAPQDDIILGFDDLDGYLSDNSCQGAVVGRYANRIGHGRFSIDQQPYRVSTNLAGHCLHGGADGFHRRVWEATPLCHNGTQGVRLALTSPHNDQGFPGNLAMTVTYWLHDDGLSIHYTANSDRPTVFSPTQHSYMNLAGHHSGDVLDTQVWLNADHYLPAMADALPTGEIRAVAATPYDLRHPTPLRALVEAQEAGLVTANGPDHNWCLKDYPSVNGRPFVAGELYHPGNGRRLRVSTDLPGVQLYAGNFLPNHLHGKHGAIYAPYQGVCLETQHFPDSPNHTHFPSARLNPGSTVHYQTHWQLR
ncbi:galactose mutarotase [Aestuariibacter halophilus]|uniref:Aldose 1-epimerase n=1 Tax=Fluctibacter halophilus TaxID=226011 RepID=A0ABS8G772_9ALTE|nr:aldose epimerase family protein [Aestuariibacter halophilus]MCC2616442.1 galactose mutarotase [Aestuariibacter halophilus]